MNRPRATSIALAVVFAGIGFIPLSSAAAKAPSSTVLPRVEAWYQPNPSCTTPIGCLTTSGLPAAPPATVPTSPFPSGTLHVGVAGGQETARTYLGFDSSAFRGATDALLTVPLDVQAQDGSTSPELSRAQVCLTKARLTPQEGSLAEPPAVDCTVSAPMSYTATPLPHLEADLTRLLPGLATATGIVLLPDASTTTPSDAWRVVFSSRTRSDAGKTEPAAVAVTAAPPSAAPGAAAAVEAPVAPAAAPALPALSAGSGAASTPDIAVPSIAGPAAPALAAPAPVAAPVAASFPTTRTVGYSYPVVWLLPLALLFGVPAVGRTLTTEIRLA